MLAKERRPDERQVGQPRHRAGRPVGQLAAGELAQSRLGLPSALTGVYQGLLLFFLLMCDTFIVYRLQWRRTAKSVAAT